MLRQKAVQCLKCKNGMNIFKLLFNFTALNPLTVSTKSTSHLL